MDAYFFFFMEDIPGIFALVQLSLEVVLLLRESFFGDAHHRSNGDILELYSVCSDQTIVFFIKTTQLK